ncbi:MAG: glutamate formimidoyltransferase [Bacillota bacterium]
MAALVECVPNFSEGRRPEVIAELAAAVGGSGVTLLDQTSDADHNRTVLTFAGTPEGVLAAAFRAAQAAVRLIDMNRHSGAHPRIGAVDVIPFVPLAGTSMADCVELAKDLGGRIARELGVPVLLYGEAATHPRRKELAFLRQGEYEALVDTLAMPDRGPDFGPSAPHATAGAVAVGARAPLVAFNVNLGTADLKLANAIAKAVRAGSGGFVNVRAKGVLLAARGQVQVSMNLVDTKSTPIHRAFELVRLEAERYGVPVVGSELIGLVPMAALVQAASHYLRLERFSADQVLEARLNQVTAGE